MSLRVYNSMGLKKEDFRPMNEGKVKMYVCGPTVYDFLHIGNFRGPIFFNLVRNWLEYLGNEVEFAYNYTDVDDKIINRANKEGVDSLVISERYIKEFETDFKALGLTPHEHNPKVTDHISSIIEIVETLIKKEKAYVIEGEVFYNIDKFSNYGALSQKKLDELDAHRVNVDKRKTNPGDFVLWKPSKEGEPSWDSPWGKGRPGWHIECSAMIRSIFGDSIDIHGGGIDLIFPHHENEIAQSEGCCDKTFARYWMHNNFINMNNEKMSKSLGNIMTARSFCENYHPEILKYLFLSVHYRSMLSVDDKKILQVMAALSRIYSAIEIAQDVKEHFTSGDEGIEVNNESDLLSDDDEFKTTLRKLSEQIKLALNDDFNTAKFVSYIFEGVRTFNGLKLSKSISKKKASIAVSRSLFFLDWIKQYGQISALFNESPSEFLNALDAIAIKILGLDQSEIESLLKEREEARSAKDWGKADEIRDKLVGMNIELTDGKGRGYRVKL